MVNKDSQFFLFIFLNWLFITAAICGSVPRTGDLTIQPTHHQRDSFLIYSHSNYQYEVENVTLGDITDQLSLSFSLPPLSDRPLQTKGFPIPNFPVSIDGNLLLTITGVSWEMVNRIVPEKLTKQIFQFSSRAKIQTDEELPYYSDSASFVTSLMTGVKQGRHNIRNKMWLEIGDGTKYATFVDWVLQFYGYDSFIISGSSQKGYAYLGGGHPEVRALIEKKRNYVAYLDRKTGKFNGVTNKEGTPIENFINSDLFGDLRKSGHKITIKNSPNEDALQKNKGYSSSKRVVQIIGKDTSATYDLNDPQQRLFFDELRLYYDITDLDKSFRMQSATTDLWMFTFVSLEEMDPDSEMFKNSLLLFFKLLPQITNRMMRIYDNRFFFQFLFTGNEYFNPRIRKEIADLLLKNFHQHIVTDLKATQVALPEIYLRRNLSLSQIKQICDQIDTQLKLNNFPMKLQCHNNINRLIKEVPPVVSPFYIKNKIQNLKISKNTFTIKKWRFWISLLITLISIDIIRRLLQIKFIFKKK
ncbi:renin receptor [Anaeramoeba flamelloides]|uniref:Renin receptor n=1 Tax=Anaeramoeba flamelloides TaxID=1746091 RepID=A0ABQ8X579_9EUKA|nr:renin receptor [Anaeramoeba flamelloides]